MWSTSTIIQVGVYIAMTGSLIGLFHDLLGKGNDKMRELALQMGELLNLDVITSITHCVG